MEAGVASSGVMFSFRPQHILGSVFLILDTANHTLYDRACAHGCVMIETVSRAILVHFTIPERFFHYCLDASENLYSVLGCYCPTIGITHL